MKKAYNVYFKNHALKFLSVMFFSFFFFGFSSSISAQALPQSMDRSIDARGDVPQNFDTDYSLSLKTQVGVSSEDAMEILVSQLTKATRDLNDPVLNDNAFDEANNTLRHLFLGKTLGAIKMGTDVSESLFIGHVAIAKSAADYQKVNAQPANMVGIVNTIVRDYTDLLK